MRKIFLEGVWSMLARLSILYPSLILAWGILNSVAIALPKPEIEQNPLSLTEKQLIFAPLSLPLDQPQRQENSQVDSLTFTGSQTPTKMDWNFAQTNEQPSETSPQAVANLESPLIHFPASLPTANHLQQGDVVFNVYNRLYFIPDSLANNATGAYPNVGVSWGVTDGLELTLEGQFVDSGNPYRQGEFQTNRLPDENAARSEVTLEAKQRFWQTSEQNLALSGVLSLSLGDRGARFTLPDGSFIASKTDSSLIPAIALPFTAQLSERWQITLSPTVAFFNEDNALFLFRTPMDNPGSFGTTFGFSGSISYEISPRWLLWADGFVPVTGNNSISRDSGKPVQTLVYNAGFRYLVNPRVALDIFASNSLGSRGPLALTADRELMALGAGVTFMPDFIAANRRYGDRFNREFADISTPVDSYGLGLFERQTLNSGQFFFSLQGGSNGIFTALSYGLVKDLEAGIYLDYANGVVDESEQGLSGRIRLLNQAEGFPITLSLGATLSQTNEPFINFFEDNRDEYKQRGLSKSIPFVLTTDNASQGKLKIVTLSLPISYQFDTGAAIWLTPVWGYVQSLGTQIVGINAGGTIPIAQDWSLTGEIGANFSDRGNVFLGDSLSNAIPWTFAVRWNPSSLLGIDSDNQQSRPWVNLYVTNRVGFSPWLQMRVRDQDRTAVGVGLLIPF